MQLFISRFLDEAQLEEAVQRAEIALSPDVVRIRYTVDEDWTGDSSIFFRVLLSDPASRPENLLQIVERVTSLIRKEVKPDEFGFHIYHDFRNESEQDELKDPTWA